MPGTFQSLYSLRSGYTTYSLGRKREEAPASALLLLLLQETSYFQITNKYLQAPVGARGKAARSLGHLR